MIDLYNSDITDILPEVFSYDPKVIALGYAIQKAMQRLITYCKNIGVFSAIDTVPEQVLDLLALELNTQYYDNSLPVETKRSLIKNTLVWFEKTGTPAAVMELVESIFGSGELEEWFEYGGDPYHFRITTSNVSVTDEMVQLVEQLVNSVQNVRSHLEEVIVEIVESMDLYVGCRAVTIDNIGLSTDPLVNLMNELEEQLEDENGIELCLNITIDEVKLTPDVITYLTNESGALLVDSNGAALVFTS